MMKPDISPVSGTAVHVEEVPTSARFKPTCSELLIFSLAWHSLRVSKVSRIKVIGEHVVELANAEINFLNRVFLDISLTNRPERTGELPAHNRRSGS